MEFTANEDTATSAERIEYLRQRGVKIEFPEGDPDAKSRSPVDGTKLRSVTVVKIPANVNRSYETLEVSVPESHSTSDPMVDVLKPYFTGGANDATIDALVAGMQDMGVGRDTLLKLAREGQVDSFPLARPSPQNYFQGVSFYVDELGQAKGLDLNSRAVALADFCGFKQVPLLGDVVIARHELVFSNDLDQGARVYKALDFSEKELDSSAAWVKDCEAANFEHGQQTGMVSMDPEAANKAANSKPTFVSVDGSGTSTALEGALGAAVSADVEHVKTWKEGADYSVEVSLDLRSILREKLEKDGNMDKMDVEAVEFSKKNVAVSIKSKSIGVGIRLGDITALHAIPLAGIIRPDESSWSFAGTLKETVEFTLEKSDQLVWNRLLE